MLSETHIVNEAHLISLSQARTSKRLYRYAKRAFDVVLCCALLPIVLFLILAISFAIVTDSSGPIFFVQERVGQNGRRFRMFKFRTLKHNCDSSTAREFMKAFVSGQISSDNGSSTQVFKPIHHAQVTRVGRILRRTSMDELPQIFNVIRGEMSLVGPRPNVPWEVEAYQDWHKQRLSIRPGLTGLAQVRGRSSISFDNIVRYDLEYIRAQSLKLDLLILWWTVKSVLSRRGAG